MLAPAWPNLLTRLALVGAGAVGSAVGRRLAQAGYHDVLVIDPDTLEPCNLLTSSLFAEEETRYGASLGAAKTRILTEYAAREHGLPWRALPCEIADVGLGDFLDRELILSCTDSALARVETAWAARTLRLPMLDAAVHGVGGTASRLTLFAAAQEAACSLCGFTAARRAELLAYAHSASLGCSLPLEFATMSATAMDGASGAAGAVADAMLRAIPEALVAQADSCARILSGEDGSAQAVQLTRSGECPWHALPPPEAIIPVAAGDTFAVVLHDLGPNAVLDLAWPLCLRACCRACGVASAPMQRAALTRRRGVCPGCGAAGTLEVLECLSSVRAGQPAAALTPAALGLPARQLYAVRRALRVA